MAFYLTYLLAYFLAYILAFCLAVEVQRCTRAGNAKLAVSEASHLERQYLVDGNEPPEGLHDFSFGGVAAINDD